MTCSLCVAILVMSALPAAAADKIVKDTFGGDRTVYLAAVTAHAGVLSPAAFPIIGQARRKIPMAIWVGTNDRFFAIPQVRATRDALNAQGFDTKLTEINGHTHDYYSRSSAINKEAWEFLKGKQLDRDPQYQDYVIGR